MSRNVIGYLKMANPAFKFLEVIGYKSDGFKFVSEQRAQKFAFERILLVSD